MNNEIDNETIWLVRKTILNWMGLVIGVAAMRAALQAADLIPAQRLRDAEAHAERLEAALQEASELIHDLIDSGDGEVDRVQRLVRTALAPQPEAPDDERAEALNVIFDGPPGPTAGRFVEVETDDGRSVRAGEWIKRDDGLWSLRIRSALADRPRIPDEIRRLPDEWESTAQRLENEPHTGADRRVIDSIRCLVKELRCAIAKSGDDHE